MNKSYFLPAEVSEKELISELKKGNESALRYLYKLYSKKLINFALQSVNDEFEAGSIINDVYTNFWLRKNSFICLEDIRSFLFISTRNACTNFYNKKKVDIGRSVSYYKNLSENDQQEAIENQIMKAEIARHLYAKVQVLPKGAQIICNLLFYEELKPCETAQLLKLSINTIRNQKARGLSLLKKMVHPKDVI